MKRERLTKEQAVLEKKRRRTNLELLKLPTGAMRTMKEIAGAADLPVGRVFQDVIEAGLAVIRSPDSSPYESMIQFRRTLHEKQSADTDRGRDGQGGSSVEHVGNGEVAEGSDAQDLEPSGTLLRLAGNEQAEERSGDADVEPGRRSEAEVVGSVSVGGVNDSPSDDDDQFRFDDSTGVRVPLKEQFDLGK